MSEVNNDAPEAVVNAHTDLYEVGDPIADAKAPDAAIEQRWSQRKFDAKLVNPANRRKHKIIVVGTGLAGASAAASLAELGYEVKASSPSSTLPRRSHSIAAQGGINAAKNYSQRRRLDVFRLFYDTVKGGDFRAREVQRAIGLAEISAKLIIDQCVSQGVPFAREYGGPSPTARSAARRSRAPSTPAGRRGSSCCSAPIRPWSGSRRSATSSSSRAHRDAGHS